LVNDARRANDLPDSASLQLRSVSVRYGAFTAVDDVSLSLPARRIVGLIGPNGAGKSTLIGTVTGEVKPNEGTVELRGHEITRLRPHQRSRRGLGWTFQNLELFPSLTVRENVAVRIDNSVSEGSRLARFRMGKRASESEDAAERALETLGLAKLGHKLVRDLSYGERKLVEFARATSVDLRVLLLDEPLAGVAVEERSQVIDVIGSYLAATDLAVLIVEHDMRAIRGLCSHVNVMVSGRIVAQGSFDEVTEVQLVRDAYLGSTSS